MSPEQPTPQPQPIGLKPGLERDLTFGYVDMERAAIALQQQCDDLREKLAESERQLAAMTTAYQSLASQTAQRSTLHAVATNHDAAFAAPDADEAAG